MSKLSKNARRKEKRYGAGMSTSELQAWHTGYTDKGLQTAALKNHAVGTQKKRDRLKWDEQDRRPFQGGAPGLGKRR